MPRRPATPPFQGWSLRRRLVVLFAIMLLPFVGFSVFKAQQINRTLAADYRDHNLALARSVAYSIDDYVQSTAELLQAVAASGVAVDGDLQALDAWLVIMLEDHPHYSNLIYVDNDGYIRAAGRKAEDPSKPVNVSDTVYFQRAMDTTGVAVGDFMYGRISGTPVVHICYPVFARDGSRSGFVSAAMHLTRVQDRLMREKTPEHTTIMVLDRSGTVIARNRDAESWVGTNVYDDFKVPEMIASSEGSSEAQLADGTRLVCAYTDVDSVPWFVRVGVDSDHIASMTAGEVSAHYAVFLPLLMVAVSGWLWIGRDVDRLHKHTEQLALVDPLTGLWNSRSMRDDLARAFEHAVRAKRTLALMMIDLDDFKAYNDRWGHVAGDDALRLIAQAIQSAIRASDRAYRYGGEEFCVVLPETDDREAAVVADRVRQAVLAVELRPAADAGVVRLSASVGLAVHPEDVSTLDALVRCADEALYRAKRDGKNRVARHCGRDL